MGKKNPAKGGAGVLNVGRESVLVSTLAWRSALLTQLNLNEKQTIGTGTQATSATAY